MIWIVTGLPNFNKIFIFILQGGRASIGAERALPAHFPPRRRDRQKLCSRKGAHIVKQMDSPVYPVSNDLLCCINDVSFEMLNHFLVVILSFCIESSELCIL